MSVKKFPARKAQQVDLSMMLQNGALATGDWSPELLKSKAYEQILLDIILGELPPGAKIDEQLLADHYGIGVAGVRDALARLSLEGMVQRRARSGTVVTSLDLIEVEQAFEVRHLLEPYAAGLAADKATPDQIAAIKSAFDGAEKAARNRSFRELVAMDQAFHRCVVVASHNLTLARIVISLHHKAARYWYYSMTTRPEHDRLEDIAQHRAVAAAIEARDPDKAYAAMRCVLGDIPDSVRHSVRRTITDEIS
ncbi:MAG: GntR family transcriptional regulator [Hyphomonadaceae bacterium]